MDISLEPKSKLRRFAPYIAAIALFIGACIWLAFSDIGKTLSVERRNLNIGEVQMGRFEMDRCNLFPPFRFVRRKVASSWNEWWRKGRM